MKYEAWNACYLGLRGSITVDLHQSLLLYTAPLKCDAAKNSFGLFLPLSLTHIPHHLAHPPHNLIVRVGRKQLDQIPRRVQVRNLGHPQRRQRDHCHRHRVAVIPQGAVKHRCQSYWLPVSLLPLSLPLPLSHAATAAATGDAPSLFSTTTPGN